MPDFAEKSASFAGVRLPSAGRQLMQGDGADALGQVGDRLRLLRCQIDGCHLRTLDVKLATPREASADRRRWCSCRFGAKARADQIESSDSVIVVCAEQVLFDDPADATGLLDAESVEDVEAIDNRVAS